MFDNELNKSFSEMDEAYNELISVQNKFMATIVERHVNFNNKVREAFDKLESHNLQNSNVSDIISSNRKELDKIDEELKGLLKS